MDGIKRLDLNDDHACREGNGSRSSSTQIQTLYGQCEWDQERLPDLDAQTVVPNTACASFKELSLDLCAQDQEYLNSLKNLFEIATQLQRLGTVSDSCIGTA